MTSSLQAAIVEAYACAKSDAVQLESLEFRHPALPGNRVYLVKNTVDLSMRLEDGYDDTTPGPYKTFTACGFSLKRPPVNPDGLQELSLTADDVEKRISSFIKQTLAYTEKLYCVYRLHLSTDLSSPQLVPPLELVLSDVDIGTIQVTARASFADLVNRPFPNYYYYRSLFPGLGS